MKKTIFLSIMVLATYAFPTTAKAAETVDVTFKFVATNTIDGYDHVSKLMVYCDDKKIGESTEKKQSQPNKIIVKIPKGNHTVVATMYALYEGKWEKRTLSNEYSFDFEYKKTQDWNTNKTINLTFDINKEKTIVSETGSGNMEIVASSQTENYKDALKKINTYLKTFDNGYYGYLEIIDDYLYDRFTSGEYSKVKISDIDVATVEEANRKVVMECKYDKECVFSTYTDSYHTKNSFSQTKDFNTNELVDLLNDFITAYNGKLNTTSSTSNSTTTSKVNNNSTALQKINAYLKTFDNGYYGYFEVKGNDVFLRFKAGKYNKYNINEMDFAKIESKYNRVILPCKDLKKCIYTDWKTNGGYEDYTQFLQSNNSFDYQELKDLLDNFVSSLKGESTSYSTKSTNVNRDQESKKRQQTKTKNNDDDDLDEDWDALESTAAKLQTTVSEYEKASISKTIAANTKVKLKDVFNKNSNYNDAKKYFGQTGITQNLMTFSGDNYFRGKIKFDDGVVMYFDNAVLEVVTTNSTSTSSTNTKYIESLKKLNDYLKIFNSETYREIEVKDGKVFFAFFVYGAKYNSSIDISELKNNTIITIGKSVGSSVVDEVKISCKGSSKYFYSTYSKGNADHFRFFSNSIKDFTKMEQLVKDFIKAL